jgi:hypothetical protein
MLYKFYIFSLLITGFISVLACLLFQYNKNGLLKKSIIAWIATRFIGDVLTITLKELFNQNVYPIFHSAILLEAFLMILYFLSMKKTFSKNTYFLFLIPIVAFIFDLFFFGGLFHDPRLGYIFYYFLSCILLFVLLKDSKIVDRLNVLVIKSLFLFHAIQFVYCLFDSEIRASTELMFLIYPIFFLSVISFNVFFTSFLWLTRKN